MLLSINQLAELSGCDRRTITQRLADLPYDDGEKGAHLYESQDALIKLYAADSLEAARAKQALSQASLNAVREEDLRKLRIPIDGAMQVVDEILQALGSTLKAAKGKKLTPKIINQIFAKFRAAPAKLKW
jgi:hypothetical protein